MSPDRSGCVGPMSVGRGMLAPMPTAPPPQLTLVTGSEEFLVARAVARAVAAVHAVSPEAERRFVSAEAPSAPADLVAALSPSLFGEAAVVVVTGLVDAGERVVPTLVDCLADPAADTWVVAVHSGARNRAALDLLRGLELAGGRVEVPCAEVKRGRPTREFLDQEARRSGRRITADGVDALVLALGQDISLLVGALEQLVADVPDDPIDAAAVATAFTGVAEVSGFQLADAVWDGHALIALERLRWGLESQSITPAGAVGSLASGLRALVRVSGAPRRMSEADVARTAGVPPFKVKALRAAADRWEPARLAAATRLLAEVDAQVKGGLRPGEALETAQKLRALEAFVLATVGVAEPGGQRGRGRPTSRGPGDLARGGGVRVP